LIWRWRATDFESAQAAATMLWTWLGSVKRRQILTMMQNHKNYIATLSRKTFWIGGRCQRGHDTSNSGNVYRNKRQRYCALCAKAKAKRRWREKYPIPRWRGRKPKLDIQQVFRIRELLENRVKLAPIAKEFSVSIATISLIKRGTTWTESSIKLLAG
ncbi:MAG: hypothetical protein AAB922_03840, partial [Patescibacteria group bacterium]